MYVGRFRTELGAHITIQQPQPPSFFLLSSLAGSGGSGMRTTLETWFTGCAGLLDSVTGFGVRL